MTNDSFNAQSMRLISGKRLLIILLIVFLHIAIFFGSFKTRQQPARESVSYMSIFNLQRLPPKREPIVASLPLLRTKTSRPNAVRLTPAKAVSVVVMRNVVDTHSAISVTVIANEAKPNLDVTATQQKPSMNIESMLSTVRTNEKFRTKTASDLRPGKESHPLTIEEKIAEGAHHAIRKDCKSAYSENSLGLLAVIPLVRDTLTGTGCKWD